MGDVYSTSFRIVNFRPGVQTYPDRTWGSACIVNQQIIDGQSFSCRQEVAHPIFPYFVCIKQMTVTYSLRPINTKLADTSPLISLIVRQ